jgi:hypothetical protein
VLPLNVSVIVTVPVASRAQPETGGLALLANG